MLPDLFNNISINHDRTWYEYYWIPRSCSKKIRAARRKISRTKSREPMNFIFPSRLYRTTTAWYLCKFVTATDTMAVLSNIFVNASDRNVFWSFFLFLEVLVISFIIEWYLKFGVKTFIAHSLQIFIIIVEMKIFWVSLFDCV